MYILCTWGLRRSSSIKASPKVSSLGSRTPLLAAWMPGSLSVKVDASQSPGGKKIPLEMSLPSIPSYFLCIFDD